jgi:hypothetical protein
MKKCRSYKTESNELDQSKDENVENHYCDIDESAMIKTLNLSEKSCDMYHGIAVDGEYNITSYISIHSCPNLQYFHLHPFYHTVEECYH